MDEKEPSKKEEAGKDLIPAIFGKDAIAENPFLLSSSRVVVAPAERVNERRNSHLRPGRRISGRKADVGVRRGSGKPPCI
jgi:hypothetical protein